LAITTDRDAFRAPLAPLFLMGQLIFLYCRLILAVSYATAN
jgi:hypothetical protein